MKRFIGIIAISMACTGVAAAQRTGSDWLTESSDAQRSAWIRSDGKISKETIEKKDPKNGFQSIWKIKLNNVSNQLNALTPPATLDRLIGYRGFRMLGFVGGSADKVFAIDTDLARLEWERKLPVAAGAAKAGTYACPGGMTTGIVRPILAAIPSSASVAMRGRTSPAKSAVGEPNQGAVTLANRPAGPPPGPPPQAPRPTPANPAGGQFGGGPFLVNAISSDGAYHSMHLSNGQEFASPIPFLPKGANASGLIVIEQTAYAVTSGSCNGVADGLWALDIASKQVSSWKGSVAGSVGPAFDGDGTIFVATGAGGENPNSIVALEGKTLKVRGSYSSGGQEFTSSPVIFELKGRTFAAASTKDGRIHLIETGKPSASVAVSAAGSGSFSPGALSSWQDRDGGRWILAAVDGSLPAGFTAPAEKALAAGGKGAIVAWKVVEQNGSISLQPGWASHNLSAPLTPTIINGVVFAVASGEYRPTAGNTTAAQRILRSGKAVAYALDGMTGKEIWNSGATMTSFAHGGAVSGGMGQVYVTTHDGTLYAFGFPMEH